MPNAVYYQSIWAVRDLERMEDRLRELSRSAMQEGDGGILMEREAGYKESKVERRAMEAAILSERVEGIRKALGEIPERYRNCILDNIVYNEPVKYPGKLWKLWKQKFLFGVAINLSIM
ncbi:MAG: hypothetical protein J5928_05135 [Firmicutes bacterium]|nr:hypothetical protein [Bacillota bacterium]